MYEGESYKGSHHALFLFSSLLCVCVCVYVCVAKGRTFSFLVVAVSLFDGAVSPTPRQVHRICACEGVNR